MNNPSLEIAWEEMDTNTWSAFQDTVNKPSFLSWLRHLEGEVAGLMAEVGEEIVQSKTGLVPASAEAKIIRARKIKSAIEVIDEFTAKPPRRARVTN